MSKVQCLICSKEFSRLRVEHLKMHGYTSKDYYDKYIRKSMDPILCKNPKCLNLVPFIKLSRGYNEFCSTKCSNSVKLTDRNLLNWRHEDYRLSRSITSTNTISNQWKTEEFRKLQAEKTKLQFSVSTEKGRYHRSLANKSSFISIANRNKVDEGYFYIAILIDCIKIGVTIKPEVKPYSYGSQLVSIYKGYVEDVAELEFQIKTALEPLKFMEYFRLEEYSKITDLIPESITYVE